MKTISFISMLLICVVAAISAPPATQPVAATTQPAISFGFQGQNFSAVKKSASKDAKLKQGLPSINYGVFVSEVRTGSGLDSAGLLAGDIIIKADQKTIRDSAAFKTWTESVVVGKDYTISVMRLDGDSMKWATKKLTFTAREKTDEEIAAAISATQPVAGGTDTGPDYVGPRGGIYHYSASGKKVYSKH